MGLRHSVSHISLWTIWLSMLQNYKENSLIECALSVWHQLSSYPEDPNCPPQCTLLPWAAKSSLWQSCAHEQFYLSQITGCCCDSRYLLGSEALQSFGYEETPPYSACMGANFTVGSWQRLGREWSCETPQHIWWGISFLLSVYKLCAIWRAGKRERTDVWRHYSYYVNCLQVYSSKGDHPLFW